MPAQAVTVTAVYEDIPPVTYEVTVTNGTGSGSYAEGADVVITANAPESGKQFKEWSGAEGLTFTNGSATSAAATFTMPEQEVTVTATYEDINAANSAGDGVVLEGPFVYNSDEDILRVADSFKSSEDVIEYGEPVYYLIIDETVDADAPVSERKYTENLKVKGEWNMGDSVVESIQVIKKYVNADAAENECGIITESGYYYFLEIVTADKKTTAETDVAGVIEFDRKANSKKGVSKIKDCKVDVDFSVFYPNTWLSNDEITEDRADIEYDIPYVLKFNYDDEVELSFGSANGGNNEGAFTVDVSGQGKVYLEYNTEPNEAIAAANEGAKLKFITFNGYNGVGVKFNRVGEFVYEMEDGAYAYKVVDGNLVDIAGLEVDDGEFKFNTNILESYVFSDTQLLIPEAE